MSPLRMLLTLLHSSSMMSWLLCALLLAGSRQMLPQFWDICKAQGKAGKNNGTKWDKMAWV